MDDDDLYKVLAAATAFTRMVAGEIVTMPLETREIAYQLAEQKLSSAIGGDRCGRDRP
jgi:hypothetical protein